MDEVVIAGAKREFFGLDASTGELRWLYEIEDSVALLSFPTLEGGVLYVSLGSYVAALDALTGASLWKYETGAPFDYIMLHEFGHTLGLPDFYADTEVAPEI